MYYTPKSCFKKQEMRSYRISTCEFYTLIGNSAQENTIPCYVRENVREATEAGAECNASITYYLLPSFNMPGIFAGGL